MSEGTTKPNGGREMNVIEDNEEVRKKIEKYGIKITATTIVFSNKRIRDDEIEENGDKINKPGEFVLASNPKTRVMVPQDLLNGNKAGVKKQTPITDKKRKVSKTKSQEDKTDKAR